MNSYSIRALDRDECELTCHDDWTCNKREAIEDAKEMLADNELIAAGLNTVRVLNAGIVEWDIFA